MKRRIVKKRLRQAERQVAKTLMLCIKSHDAIEVLINDEWRYLGFCLTYLLMYRLALYHPKWPYGDRWIDDIVWDVVSVNIYKEFNGIGTLWWGNRLNVAGEMAQIRIEVKLRILKVGKRPRITYNLLFSSDGELYHINNNRELL